MRLLPVAGRGRSAAFSTILAVLALLVAPDPGVAQAVSTASGDHAGPPLPTRQAPYEPSLRAPARPSALLDKADELATLQAIQTALTQVSDGSTFVWHRRHGHLSGLVRPTASFKDAKGAVCRHIVLMLSSRGYTRRAEGIACRNVDGVWSLAG